ncbi:oligosaccharide flippase family protein [Paenibacillus protaetiae]|uniref:Polysaccharide biosynthesis protein C-terminal domain-containing protein n=1 Tax=Paenibacillus protaetiae TaxID=2509456 RepID=A0A4P6F1H4_9BACL|nr:oligosaccharide flippase family protein [Paenibacillus protaetiae]QAY68503.1 hypothetical protein ET464_13160 [Paenibacillus protaetiae]
MAKRFKSFFQAKGLLNTILKTSFTNMLMVFLNMLISVITARIFGVEGRGELTAILFWPTFLSSILSFGLPMSLIYNVKNSKGSATDFIRTCFMFQIPLSAVMAIVIWIFIPHWMGGYGSGIIQTARWYTLFAFPLFLAMNVISAMAQSLHRFEVYNNLRLFMPVANFLGLVALGLLHVLSITAASAVYLGTSLLVILWAFYRLRHDLKFDWLRKLFDKTVAAALFRYGGKVYGVDLLGTLYNQFDKLIILSMLTAKELGLYTVVYSLSRLFNVAQSAITSVLFPTVAEMDKDKVIRTVVRAFRITLLIMLAALVPCMVLGHLFLGIVFGSRFMEGGTAFYLLCIECVIGGNSWLLATAFNAIGRPGFVLFRQIVALAVTVGLMFMLAPAMGINGVALSMLAGSVVRMVLSVGAVKMTFKTPLSHMLIRKEDMDFVWQKLQRRRSKSKVAVE